MAFYAKKAPAPRGLYLWGGGGRGKSMLMDLFYDHVEIAEKRRVHFHAFMQEVHAGIDAARKDGAEDPIKVVAKQMAKTATLLCFDEFQITDIADAMLLGRLFESLFERAVALPKEAQEAFIADNAGDSPEIAAQLRAMLAADAQATSGSDLLARAQASDNDLIGTEIDRWRLLERIGSGGMGVVFLAERTDGNLEQRAAGEVRKRGRGGGQGGERGRQEKWNKKDRRQKEKNRKRKKKKNRKRKIRKK